jgi:signal transduction histidine kinase
MVSQRRATVDPPSAGVGSGSDVPVATERPASPTVVTVLRVLAVARWLVWVWMVAVVAVSADDGALRQPFAAWCAVAAVLAAAATATFDVRTRPSRLLTPWRAAFEAAMAIGLTVADGWVFEPGHVFETSQSLATQYPVIAVASIAFAVGPVWAASVGALMGPAEWVAARLNGFGPIEPRHVVSLAATSLFFAIVGAVVGWFSRLLRDVESEIADRRARDEVARVMHDTVLQVFALVERRTEDTDPDLARSVRDADRDLRRFLFGAATRDRTTLDAAVRAAVERATSSTDLDVVVNVVDGDDASTPAEVAAVSGALAEAVINVVKHARATRVVVFVEELDGGAIVASVRDDGVGIDRLAPHGHGIRHSILDRMRDVGGEATIAPLAGGGTEVTISTRVAASTDTPVMPAPPTTPVIEGSPHGGLPVTPSTSDRGRPE